MFLRHSKPLSGFTTLIRMLLQGIFEKIFKSCYIFLKSQKMLLHVKNSFFLKKEDEKESGWSKYYHFQNFDNVISPADIFFWLCFSKIVGQK